MYHRWAQQVRRCRSRRRVHEARRREREAANREQLRAVVHTILR